MAALARDQIDGLIKRLESIEDGAEPKWGTLRKDSLIEHLLFATRMSMGSESSMPFRGNFVMVNILGPLFIREILPFPKNIKPSPKDGPPIDMRMEGDINDLRAALEEFVTGLEQGTLQTPMHPAFGDLGPEGWARMHGAHFAHHLKQFGV